MGARGNSKGGHWYYIKKHKPVGEKAESFRSKDIENLR